MKISEEPASDGEAANTETSIEVAGDSPTTTVPDGSSASDSESKDARIVKKRRLHEPAQHDENQKQRMVMVPGSASFAGLPFDILEIILERTGFPGDVISVSKTCRTLREKLKEQSAAGLWRRMRNAVALPDPSDVNFMENVEGSNEVVRVERFVGKEAEYTAFVFSEGDCEVWSLCERLAGNSITAHPIDLRKYFRGNVFIVRAEIAPVRQCQCFRI